MQIVACNALASDVSNAVAARKSSRRCARRKRVLFTLIVSDGTKKDIQSKNRHIQTQRVLLCTFRVRLPFAHVRSSLSLSLLQKPTDNNESRYSNHEEFEETPTWAAVITVLGYAILSALGWLRDFLRHIGLEEKRTATDPNPKVDSISARRCERIEFPRR